MQTPKYTITNESVTLIMEGRTYTVRAGERNFQAIVGAIMAQAWDKLPELTVAGIAVEKWVGEVKDFTYSRERNAIFYLGDQLPDRLSKRIVTMADTGADPSGLLLFWQRLQRNPSMRSVTQLYSFLEHKGIPIDKEGYILAYKGVKPDYTDVHSGTFDNRPGNTHEMPRNKISDDPREACHVGFHVGSLQYARDFGSRTVIVRVDPEHVVSVPYDHSAQKMRVCRYEVIGNYGDKLPDAYIDDTEVEVQPKATKAPAKTERPVKSVADKGDDTDPTQRSLWEYLIDTPDNKLSGCNLQHLRKYARHELKIVRASKIPGGKPVLVQRIIETRRGIKQDD